MEQDPVTYTYEEMAGNKQIKIEGLDEPEPMAYEPEESYNSGEESLNDESVLNGEFVPKERIIVSQSAKDAMKRKPLINPYLHFHDFIICSAGMQSRRHE